jgi:mannose-6-phosphate isomerase-like protein (cupin superfamily)
MKKTILPYKSNFKILTGNKRSQAAEMVIKPGDKEGWPGNRHKGSDQWLYVAEGKGVAIVNKKKIKLKQGSLILIERGEEHEIKNTTRKPLKTLNFYIPPAYRKNGDLRPAGQPR